jgi:hypothetical protein
MCRVKCSVSEEYTASVFSVTELLQADAEATHSKKCVAYVRSLERVWLITATKFKNCHLMKNCCENLEALQEEVIFTVNTILVHLVYIPRTICDQ